MRCPKLKMLVSVIITVMLTGMSSYGGVSLTHLSVYRDKTITPEKRIDILLEYLHKEIAEPTKRHSGIDGDIYHEYVLAQIARGIYYVAKEQKTRTPLHLRMQQESGMARKVLVIALGNCGDKGVIDELIKTATSDYDTNIRKFAIHGLLQCKAYYAIPELIYLLSDKTMYSRHDFGMDRAWFPVRNQSWIVLKNLGVSSQRNLDTLQYTVDCQSAVQVLQKALNKANENDAYRILSSISRIGGPDAKKTLQKYVDINANKPEKAALTSHAIDVLKKTLDITIEDRRDKSPLIDKILTASPQT